jgi:hypothetical protein
MSLLNDDLAAETFNYFFLSSRHSLGKMTAVDFFNYIFIISKRFLPYTKKISHPRFDGKLILLR